MIKSSFEEKTTIVVKHGSNPEELVFIDEADLSTTSNEVEKSGTTEA